ncbi:hypothetical protein LG201_08410 [Methylobacillus gramineus]|uniref:hypothetical protein n=1 Tax=Methylobacillus gramineus TaxID=755169 RepID=UPI001CFFA7E4|nr:hypothetical protein [Methylobacillus gramineus]MCB5185225.1 hypothetical protein [Methylobacillus gramineus]
MNKLSPTSPSYVSELVSQLNPTAKPAGASASLSSNRSEVKISQLGQLLSSFAPQQTNKSNPNQDIDDSDLPDLIKTILKQIRKLQEQLREQQQRLQAIMANQHLSADERKTQLLEVQAAISTLHTGLSAAMKTLHKTMSDQGLSKEQMATVASLLSK